MELTYLHSLCGFCLHLPRILLPYTNKHIITCNSRNLNITPFLIQACYVNVLNYFFFVLSVLFLRGLVSQSEENFGYIHLFFLCFLSCFLIEKGARLKYVWKIFFFFLLGWAISWSRHFDKVLYNSRLATVLTP